MEADDKVIDSQILAENVGFLQNCFDNSFTIENSLKAVKEYFADSVNDDSLSKRNKTLDTSNLFDTSIAHQEPQVDKKESLKEWSLPPEIGKKYEEKGISNMFSWQAFCLGNKKVLFNSCNLVYSAPTSAGKTLVAEILTIKTVIERQKKVIIILPFVSIVREKTLYFQDLLSSSGIRVEGFMGTQSPPGGLQAVHIAICTIEKANSLVNRLLDEGKISELGAVVVDELHLLGDPHRGYILELLLTKIKYITSKRSDVVIQIIGMSATLPNLEALAQWLNAELFITQFRPIPLDEYCLVGSKLYSKDSTVVNKFDFKPNQTDSDHVLNICLETIKDGCSVLIFCMTKNRCENLAQSIAQSFYNIGNNNGEFCTVLRDQLSTEKILEVLEQLKNCPFELDVILKTTVSFGVAYHHAGLTFDERDIIEGGFKSGAIRVLVATSTLSSGVNLPARTVIIRTPVFQRQPINIMTYKQMIGRAGRMGKDTRGESILICTEYEKNIGFQLMNGLLDSVKSCIESEDRHMRALLEMIASQTICSKMDIELYSKCTLLYAQKTTTSQNDLLDKTIKQLKHFELIREQNINFEVGYAATPLGKACLSASVGPNDGISLFMELQRARQCLVLDTDLHLIYLVTPYSVSNQWGEIDWLYFFSLTESLTKEMQKVSQLVGIQKAFILSCSRGNSSRFNNDKMNIHKRFYTALALHDLINEVPLSDVAGRFKCARGFLQSLQQAAATFVGMVTAFCHQLGWKNMELLISQFQDRLHFGIHSELTELVKLNSLNSLRARALFNAGFETLTSIATADVNVIENVLYKALPFQSEKARDGEHEDDLRKRNKIRSIWITGCCGKTPREAAESLIAEARKYLQDEIGVKEIKWNNNAIDTSIINSNKTNDNDVKHNIIQDNTTDIQTSILFSTKDVNNIKQEPNDEITINRNHLLKSQSTPILSPEITFDSPNLVKDELEWESLILNETELRQISTRASTNYSPNISFGESDKGGTPKTFKAFQSTSKETRDISLFSSDGDNSSVFEDSLPLDLVPSKLLDNRVDDIKKETTNDFVNINSNSIMNVFKSLITDTDEEDMKLVYSDSSTSNVEFKTPTKRSKQKNKSDPKRFKLQMSTSAIDLSGNKFKCLTLKGDDVKLLPNYVSSKEISISFVIEKQDQKVNLIGKIQNEQHSTDDIVKGFAICSGDNRKYCVYVDLTSINNQKNKILKTIFDNDYTFHVSCLKSNYYYLNKHLGLSKTSSFIDVLIAEWIINCSDEPTTLEMLANRYANVDLKSALYNYQAKSKLEPQIEASANAWSIRNVALKQMLIIGQRGMSRQIIDRETHISIILSESEKHGITLDKDLASSMLIKVKKAVACLQKRANTLAGCNVNIKSSNVAKLLNLKSKGKGSTKKSVLLCHNSPLASVIVYWRKLDCILTKILYPVTKIAVLHSADNRIKPSYSTHTSTGRMYMHDPNLQNVPRTFTIPSTYIDETVKINSSAVEFNCRSIFKASPGYVIVSADYCQLEMRILTHFSEDEILTDIMKKNQDVFRSIAASWCNVRENEVDEDMRHKSKQLCYGMLYGMGERTLAQHLDVTELDAENLMYNFYKTFPKIKPYKERVIQECSEKGYVETLMKRRRYLPDINNKLLCYKSAAERQAVNTTIQGSAADIAKAAMCEIDNQTNNMIDKPRLLLQMHDELIYEVKENNKLHFATILKIVMERTVKLNVPLPVKVKCGYSWGELCDFVV